MYVYVCIYIYIYPATAEVRHTSVLQLPNQILTEMLTSTAKRSERSGHHSSPSTAGMSNMRPFASTTAARKKDTVIWSFNGQNCSFYNLNWINVRRSQKNGPMLFFIPNDFYTWKCDRLFPSVKNSLNKENILYVRYVKHAVRRPHVVCGPHDNTNVTHMALGGPSVWHAWSTVKFTTEWACSSSVS
jgi:hypothetical protein